jgi:hypothetical protein
MSIMALGRCVDGQCRITTVAGGTSSRNSVEISAAVGENEPNRLNAVRVIHRPDGRIDPEGKTHIRLREFFIPANPYRYSIHSIPWEVNDGPRIPNQG